MQEFFTIRYFFTAAGIALGWLYWDLYACTEGCAITSTWYGSMAIGGLFGHGIGDVFTDLKEKFIR
jgi:hypothetical protein